MGPFDASPCPGATLDDLEFERMAQFIRTARVVRQFPLPLGTPPPELLEHMNLLDDRRLTNAAVLLFGKAPQRFVRPSEASVRSLPRNGGGQAHSVVPGLQGNRVRTRRSGGGLRAEQDQPAYRHPCGKREGTPNLRDTGGGRDRGHRQRRRPPGLHGQRQRAGHAVCGPPGSPQSRQASTALDLEGMSPSSVEPQCNESAVSLGEMRFLMLHGVGEW